jgi:hypothetical protein
MKSRTLLGLGLAAALVAAGATAFAAAPAPQPNAAPRPLAPPQNTVPQGAQPYAQQPPYPQQPYAQQPYGQPPPGDQRTYRQAYRDDYLGFLRNTLRITPAQQPLWQRFEGTVRQNTDNRAAQRPAPRDPRAGPMPLPDRLAQRRMRLDAERARLDALDAALRPLYASLTEEQRRIADVELLGPRMAAAGPARALLRDRLRMRRPFRPL